MARHDAQKGQKCFENRSPFKNSIHKWYNFPCSTLIDNCPICALQDRHPPVLNVPLGTPSLTPALISPFCPAPSSQESQ